MKPKETMKANLESVLLEFRVEADMPRPGILETYCRRYPQFARELTDYAVDWLLDEAMASEGVGDQASSASSPIVSRAISHLYNGMREREAAKKMAARTAAHVSGHNPFLGLPVPCKREICAQLGIDMTILAKLQNRLIDPMTIPRKFLGRLAEALRQTMDDIVGHLKLSSVVTADDFKAEGKPAAPSQKQRFEEAVRASSLDEEQKRALLED